MHDRKPIIYLDNAATSWPKPPSVAAAMERSMRDSAANPGRGSHAMAVSASRVLFEARKRLARLFRVMNPNDIAFALNATHALNLAIQGVLKPGDHVVTTTLEHNSVRRPLEALKRTIGIGVTYIRTDKQGRFDLKELEQAITPKTKLIAVSHSSNLLGSIAPIEAIGAIARRKGVKLLVDAAQSAGALAIDVEAMGIDLLAFPGHKGLLGPQGTGGLYIHPELDLEPLMHGGTGSKSESPEQPTVRPDRYEAGTQNTVGIAGLSEGVAYVLKETPRTIHAKELELTFELMAGLLELEGVTVLGPAIGEERTAIVSFLVEGIDPSELSFVLDQQFGIAVRAGFHCTPLGHETAGSYETGAVRASPGYFTEKSEIVSMIAAVKEVARTLRNRA
ncbi:aminotransferase class V-fold PLP-dependent enzyme [Paenibacillaceae bacterium WGS1546]|uniref:aminotransferase class V-fold PLP-dependent enzyme n=1 Tax=Cohnella sp. WGS1546 TaxID=3366810 RepID=UPI00372D5518